MLQTVVSNEIQVLIFNEVELVCWIRIRFKQGLIVESCTPTFEENLDINDFAGFSEFVEETARQKVLEVADDLNKKAEADGKPKVDIVIGADTMVTMDGTMFGKPIDAQDAFNTLQKWVRFQSEKKISWEY